MQEVIRLNIGAFLQLLLVAILVGTCLYFWTKHDLEMKAGYTLYDKDGKKISNFGDWLEGREDE